MSGPRERREQGFTLIELLMAITISGILIGALVGGFIVAMKGTAGAHERFIASQGAQTLATYFTSDAQSANPNWVTTGAADTGCPTTPAGTNVVRMQWTELTAASRTAYSVSYRTELAGTEWRLVRYACTASQSATAPGTSAADVIAAATPPPALSAHTVATDLSDPTAQATLTDVVTTTGSADITSASAAFTTSDLDQAVAGAGIPAGATIASVVSATQATLTATATATATGVTVTLDRYQPVAKVVGDTISLKAYAALGDDETVPYSYTVAGTMRTPTTHVFVVDAPATQQAGTPFTVTVTATKNGATDAAFTGTVRFTSSDAQAVLPADYTFVAGDNGVHTFTNGVTLKTSGDQTVITTDTAQSTSTGGDTVTVTTAPLASFSVVAPAAATAGSPFSVTVKAKDAFNNTLTGYTGTARFASSDGAATLPADYPFTAADAGGHTFTNGVTLTSVGSQTVEVSDGASTGSASVAVAAPDPTAPWFDITAPATSDAGDDFSITVTARDATGAPLGAGYLGTIHFTSTDTQADLPPTDYTFEAVDNGTHTFTNAVTLKTAGGQAVSVTDTTDSAMTGSAIVTVNPGAVSAFLVDAPAVATAGDPFSVTVTAKDVHGNTVTGYAGTIDFESSDDDADLPADYTFVPGDTGVHTFLDDVTLKTAGSQSLTAGTTSGPSKTGTTAVTVTGAAPSALAFTGCSVNGGTAGACSNPALGNPGEMAAYVSLVDAYGNPATVGPSTSWTVTVTRTSGSSNFVVTDSPVTIAGTGNQSATRFHVAYSNSSNGSANAVLTAHATSATSAVADATMTVRK